MRFKAVYISHSWQWGVRDLRKRNDKYLKVWNVEQSVAREIATLLNQHKGKIDADVVHEYYLKCINPLTKWLS